MELNFVSFDEVVTYSHEAPHHVVFGEVDELQVHIAKYSEYFCEYHYFHLIKVEDEVVGLIIESLM